MKKLIFVISILTGILFYLPTQAVVAYDNTTEYAPPSPATSHTIANYTVGTPNPFLLVGVQDYSDTVATTQDITSITYNGSSMTRQVKANPFGTATRRTYLYFMYATSTVTSNIVINFVDSTDRFRVMVVSYKGVSQSGFPEVTNNSGSNSSTLSRTLSTLTDNAWVGMYGVNGVGSFSAGSGTTMRGGGNYENFADNNAPKTPIGSVTLNLNHANGVEWGIIYTLNPTLATSAIIPENDIIIFD